MADRAADLLRKKLQEQEARTERLRTILKFLEEDPALAVELFEILKDPDTNGWVPPVRFGKDLPASDKLEPILTVFKEKGDETWVSVSDIAKATGFKRHMVNVFLTEGRHANLFETDLPHPKRRYFRVKKERTTEGSEPAVGAKRKRSRKKPKVVAQDDANIIRPKWGPPNAKFIRIEGSEDTKRIE